MRTELGSLLIQLLIFACVLGAIQQSEASQLKPEKRPANISQGSIGPFELSSADSSSRIRFQFASQLRMFFESKDKGAGEQRTEKLVMEARRIRLTLTGSLMKPALSYKLHLSAAPHSLELMDYYFNYRIRSYPQFRFGQYNPPFSRYRIQSFQRLIFVDWALVTKYFGAERQMGLALHNGYERPPKWAYAFGVFTGVNALVSHNVGLAKLYGEELTNPSDLSDPGPRAEYHPELFLHLSLNANGIQVRSDTDMERRGPRYSIGLSVAWDIDPEPGIDYSTRFSQELLFKYRGVSVSCIGYAGFSEMGASEGSHLAALGGLFQTAYRIDGRYEITAMYAIADFTTAAIDDARARAAESAFDPVVRDEEIRLGVNLYLAGHSLKLQNDVGRLRRSYSEETRIDYVVRSQFQIAF